MFLIVVRHKVSDFDSSVVMHELKLAINRAVYVFVQFRTILQRDTMQMNICLVFFNSLSIMLCIYNTVTFYRFNII